MFPKTKPRGTLKVKGKQNLLFSSELVIQCFVIVPNSKLKQTAKNLNARGWLALAFAAVSWCTTRSRASR